MLGATIGLAVSLASCSTSGTATIDVESAPGTSARPAPDEAERPASSAPDVLAADVTKVAMVYKKALAETGSYDKANYDNVELTGENYVSTSASSTDAGFLVCVVEPATGAWALWESASDGISQQGDSDSTCGPTQTVGG